MSFWWLNVSASKRILRNRRVGWRARLTIIGDAGGVRCLFLFFWQLASTKASKTHAVESRQNLLSGWIRCVGCRLTLVPVCLVSVGRGHGRNAVL
ncbi:unnamed protein product [Ectocarpus sp. 12 AP-2014]